MSGLSEKIYGTSPDFSRVLHAARMVAMTSVGVLLIGEPGSGKRTLARQIHLTSPRRKNEFDSINCVGLDAQELEQRLQEAASGGTLYLNEVADLSLQAQAKLLQFMDKSDVGSGGEPDVRLLVSTGQDLEKRQQQGLFRQDLYFRLHVVPLALPPLRERKEDLVPLLKQFTADLARHHGRKAPRYSVTARNLIRQYRWPGNVRELHNFCEQMVILHSGNLIQPADMPLAMRQDSVIAQGESLFVLPENGVDLMALEGDVIRQALVMSGGNRSKAARLLGLSRDTLLYRIQKHAIEV